MKTPVLLLLMIVGYNALNDTETDKALFLCDAYINQINAEQDQWKAGRNFHVDTSLSTIKLLLGTWMDDRDLHPAPIKSSDPHWPSKRRIPKYFDARKRWKKCPTIGEVLDQGMCGSSWAMSVAQAFTDRYCIATKGKVKTRLATNQILSCCSECGDGCSGGSEAEAWNYVSQNGLVTGDSYNTFVGCQPYPMESPCRHNDEPPSYPVCPKTHATPQCYSTCTNYLFNEDFDDDIKSAQKYYQIEPNVTSIQRDVMAYGPITVAFSTYNDFLHYKTGVYEPVAGATEIGGHSVKLIGWGVSEETPYWLIMNSWNPYWGDQGLAKIKRGSDLIKLESAAYAAVPQVYE